MTEAAMRAVSIIGRKIIPPPLSADSTARTRLDELLLDLMRSRRVVLVTATAGSGKTTAVVAATSRLGRPTAWLTVDDTDRAPGRLVTYLEAALGRVVPSVVGVASQALAAGLPHAEAAGILAEALGDEPLLLVVDEVERLGQDAASWLVLDVFRRYAAQPTGLVLISRRSIPAELFTPSPVEVATVGEADLAFLPAEARAALARVGKADVDAARAVESTGGWVTGVLFEAWRSDEHVSGAGGEADPLYGYLSTQILNDLDPQDRDFLERTALLDEVTAARAEALGVTDAGTRLITIRAAHVPVTWSPDGSAMRCHSRFREYLLQRLERRGQAAIRDLRLAHAAQLSAEGSMEEATDEYLRAGAPREALRTAELAIMRVIERTDFAVAERWLEALGDVAPTNASLLTAAEVMLALAKDDIRRIVRIADQLDALGERERLVALSDGAAWTIAWAYMHVIRTADVLTVLNSARPGATVDALRYALGVMDDPPSAQKSLRPPLTGTPVDALIATADYALGRLAELSESSATQWEEAVKLPWRIGALRAMGHTQRALELYDSALATGSALALEAFAGPEVLLDAGQVEDARRALSRGREHARASGAIALEAMNALAEAKLALRWDRDPKAAKLALDRPACRAGSDGYRLMAGIRDVWLGCALLLEGQDLEARTHLQRAVASMVAGDRLLELPTAAVYLAEAEWRLDDEDAAGDACELALTSARRQGSNHLLLQALADFPAVLSRQIDAQSSPDSEWHSLGRRLLAQSHGSTALADSAVELKEFGQRTLIVGGSTAHPRIAKTYELLAYLATRHPPAADKRELLEVLFDARTDESARSYLRQAVNALRAALPVDAVIVDRSRVTLTDAVAVRTESLRFEAALAEAARLHPDARLSGTLAALEVFGGGEYLPGSRSQWADQRQQYLGDLATNARYEAAELALAAGQYEQARASCEQVLRADGFRESAWRLSMRIADALGDEAGVVRAYRACEQALRELGATPSPSTMDLMQRLRR
jgi:ATP/maltotriose-dependent transcriptional regulator MalT/DNA-binding SARP family transcriptional activator